MPAPANARAAARGVGAGEAVAALHVGKQGRQLRLPLGGAAGVEIALAAHLGDGAFGNALARERTAVLQLQHQGLQRKALQHKARCGPQARVVDGQAPKAQRGLAQQLGLGLAGAHLGGQRRRRLRSGLQAKQATGPRNC